MNATVSVALAMFASMVLLGSAVVLGPVNRAYAHTFQGGESAEFLTMVQVIEVQASLAAENLSDPDIAEHHVEHASEALTDHAIEEIAERNERIANDLPASLGELEAAISSGASADEVDLDVRAVSDLLAEATQVRIEEPQLNNSTVRAVVVANLVNEALERYGEAVGFEGNMTDMSSMNMTEPGMSGMESGSMEGSVTIVNVANYQSSLAFAEKAQELYAEIRQSAIEGTDSAVEELDAAFPDFVSAIEDEASPMEVMRVAHVEIHPSLMTAYDLQIIPEFPLPLLVAIPALAGAILYGRFIRKG